uniref:Uncharacterized protein n=2 Tax=Auxenochlorella protothecoides TaxID=3075 RepID=A0A1D1ZP51_AUXPR
MKDGLESIGYFKLAAVVCGDKHGILLHYGDESTHRYSSSRLFVQCAASCCAEKPLAPNSRGGSIFTPNGFESHCGLAHRKKWRTTLRVFEPGKALQSLGSWAASCFPDGAFPPTRGGSDGTPPAALRALRELNHGCPGQGPTEVEDGDAGLLEAMEQPGRGSLDCSPLCHQQAGADPQAEADAWTLVPWSAVHKDLERDVAPHPPEAPPPPEAPRPPKALHPRLSPESTPRAGHMGTPRATGSALRRAWPSHLDPAGPPSPRPPVLIRRARAQIAAQGLMPRDDGGRLVGQEAGPQGRMADAHDDGAGGTEVFGAVQGLLLQLLASTGLDVAPPPGSAIPPPAAPQQSASSASAAAVASPPRAVQPSAGPCPLRPPSVGGGGQGPVDSGAGSGGGCRPAARGCEAQSGWCLDGLALRLSVMERGYQQLQRVVQVLLKADLELSAEVHALRSACAGCCHTMAHPGRPMPRRSLKRYRDEGGFLGAVHGA